MPKPKLRIAGWNAEFNSYYAKTDGLVWWYEERLADGSVKRIPLIQIDQASIVALSRS